MKGGPAYEVNSERILERHCRTAGTDVMRFDGFYGNEQLKQRLNASEGKFSHFYILEGPSGSGKKTLAKILSAAMECETGGEIPCGVCPACRKVFHGTHPDIITVDSDTAMVPVRLIRGMQADAFIRPNEGQRKIYCIPRAGDMQAPAQNALLKLLEEPPEYCAFLLLTENSEKLLETIRSRAVTLSLSPLSREQLKAAILEREPNVSPESLERAVRRSDGFLGAALEDIHAPETSLDRQAAELLSAFASGDELSLLKALAPLEKLQRQDLLLLLEDIKRSLVYAMNPNAAPSVLSACTPAQLYTAAEAVSFSVKLLQNNSTAGHAVGSLMVQMRRFS